MVHFNPFRRVSYSNEMFQYLIWGRLKAKWPHEVKVVLLRLRLVVNQARMRSGRIIYY